MARETLNTAIVDQSQDRGDRSGGFDDRQRVPSAPRIRRDHELPAVTGELPDDWETPYVPEFSPIETGGQERTRRSRGAKRRREKRGRRSSDLVTTKTTGGTVVTFPPQNAPGTTAPDEQGDIARTPIPTAPGTKRPAVPSPPPGSFPPGDPAPADAPFSPPQPTSFEPAAAPVPTHGSQIPSSDETEEIEEQSFARRTSELPAGNPSAEAATSWPQDQGPEPMVEDSIDLRADSIPTPGDTAPEATPVSQDGPIGQPISTPVESEIERVTLAPRVAGPATPETGEFEDDEDLEALLADLSAATGTPSPAPDFQLASRPEPDLPPNHAAEEPLVSEQPAQEPGERFQWDLTPPLPLEDRPPSLMEMLAPPIDDISFAPPAPSARLADLPPPVGPAARTAPGDSPRHTGPPDVSVPMDPPINIDPSATVEVSPRTDAAVQPALIRPTAEARPEFSAPPLETHDEPNPPLFGSRRDQQRSVAGTVAHSRGRAGKSAAETFASETSLLPAKTRRGDVRVADPSAGGSWFTQTGQLPVIQVAGEKPKRRRKRLRRFFRRLMTGLLLCAVLGAALFAALSTIYL